MRKQRIHLFVAGLVVLAVLIVLGLRHRAEPDEPDQPMYGGKKLSEWVEMLGGDSRGYDRAVEAIPQIGPNAIPYLVSWIRYESLASKTKSTTSHSAEDDRRKLRANRTVKAFLVLRHEAEGAIPSLTDLMNDTRSPETAVRAKLALEGSVAAPETHARDVLASWLIDPDSNVRLAATNALKDFPLRLRDYGVRVNLQDWAK